MEGASLRPVPLRPAGPVDAEAAFAHVTAMLPDLYEPARRALALAELGGLDRATVAMRLGLDLPAAAAALARGRKALRRSMFPLSATGWCERAEGLLSDRMDGELPARAAARLDAHLSNCDRCQTHELRLAQALDTLGRTFVVAAPPRAPQLAPPAPEPPEPPAEPEAPPQPAPPRLHVIEPVHPPAQPPEPEAEAPPAEPEAPPEPPPAPEPEQVAAAARVATPRLGLAAATWHILFLIAVLLAVATIVVTALAIGGVDNIL